MAHHLPRAFTYRSLHATASNGPIILVFGWLGGSERNVNKYAEAWTNLPSLKTQRPKVVAFPSPVLSTLVPSMVEKRVSAILDATRQLVLAEREHEVTSRRPVILHVMSMAGYLSAGWLLAQCACEEMERDSSSAWLTRSIGAVVCDSSPAFITPDLAARGILTSLGLSRQNPLTRTLMPAATAAVNVYLEHNIIRWRLGQALAAWGTIPRTVPRLILASATDAVIPLRAVQDFVAAEWPQGDIHWRLWTDAPHVEILRQDPDGYMDSLDAFVQGRRI